MEATVTFDIQHFSIVVRHTSDTHCWVWNQPPSFQSFVVFELEDQLGHNSIWFSIFFLQRRGLLYAISGLVLSMIIGFIHQMLYSKSYS